MQTFDKFDTVTLVAAAVAVVVVVLVVFVVVVVFNNALNKSDYSALTLSNEWKRMQALMTFA
jgi:ABC-type phosphate transport system permease subunit